MEKLSWAGVPICIDSLSNKSSSPSFMTFVSCKSPKNSYFLCMFRIFNFWHFFSPLLFSANIIIYLPYLVNYREASSCGPKFAVKGLVSRESVEASGKHKLSIFFKLVFSSKALLFKILYKL